jgi:hypothetical protein
MTERQPKRTFVGFTRINPGGKAIPILAVVYKIEEAGEVYYRLVARLDECPPIVPNSPHTSSEVE